MIPWRSTLEAAGPALLPAGRTYCKVNNPITCDEAGTLMDLVNEKINDLYESEEDVEARIKALHVLAKKLEALC